MPGRGELRVFEGPRKPMDICHHCSSFVYMVQVSGHLECPRCHSVAETCCEGITQAKAAETETDTAA